MKKPFSNSLYTKNDDAKHLVIKWLDEQGYEAHVNPDKYGIDLLGVNRDTGRKIQVEVEVKHNWSGQRFPFDTVHFPARKLKFVNPKSFFIMLNKERTHILVVSGNTICHSKTIKKSTVYTSSEDFMEVSATRCFIYPLKEEHGKQE
jgi:hypothetical protein